MALVVALPVIGAPFGPVDDHEIIAMARGQLPVFVELTRFRPLYYLLRLLETDLWGTNVLGWAMARIGLAIVTMALTYSIARRWVSPSIAILAGLLVVAGPQAEAFYRFGPQEAYATPMLLVAVWGVLRGRGAYLAFAVAAAFTKEPFAFAAIAVCGWAWWRGHRRAALLAAVPITAVCAWVLYLGLAHPPIVSGNAGRYVLPWVLVPIGVAAYLASRWHVVRVAMAGAIGLGLALSLTGAASWAKQNRDFQAELAEIRAAVIPGVPLIVHADVDHYERALTLRIWIPEGDAMLAVDPGSGPLWQALEDVSLHGGHGYQPLTTPGVEVRL